MIKILSVLLYLLLIVHSHQNSKKYVAFYSALHKGHIFPLRGIAHELHKRGYRTSFAIPKSYNKFFEGVNTEIIQLDFDPYIEDREIMEVISRPENRGMYGELRQTQDAFYNMSFEVFPHVLPIYKKDKPDLIVTDFLSFGGYTLADLLGVPYVTNFPVGLIYPIPGYTEMNYDHFIEPNVKKNGFSLRMMNFLFKLGLMEKIIVPLLLYRVNKFRYKLGLKSVTYEDIIMKPMVIHQSSFALMNARTLPPNIRLVGPCLLEPRELPKDYLDFLNEKENVIFISFGTISVLDKNQISKLSQVIEQLKNYRFLWSLPSNQHFLLPKPLPGNLKVENFVPQMEILAHPSVKLFISHGGFGGVHESLSFGKPILCIPFCCDQIQNSAHIIEKKVGLTMDKLNFTVQEAISKIEKLLNDEQYVKNAQRIANLFKLDGGCKAAADAIEEALLGMEHLTVPYLKVQWWEHAALDAWLLVMVSTFALLWIGKIILSKMFISKKIKEE